MLSRNLTLPSSPRRSGAEPVPDPAATFLAGTIGVGGITNTFAAQNLGAAQATRKILVCIEVSFSGLTAASVASVTVGGIAATIIQQFSAGATNLAVICAAIAEVPSGTSGDIVVTASRSTLMVSIQTFRLVGTPLWSFSHYMTSTTPLSASVVVPVDGIAFGFAFGSGGSSATATWTNLTEVYDAVNSINRTFTAAFAAVPAGGTVAASVAFSSGTAAYGMFLTFGRQQTFNPRTSVTGYVPALYNVTELFTAGALFRDSAKALPVTTAGQIIRAATVAPGVDWTSDTDAEAPTLFSDGGGKYSIAGDGADDWMHAPAASAVQLVVVRAMYTGATFSTFNGLFTGPLFDDPNLWLAGDSGQARFFKPTAHDLYRFNGVDLTAGTWTAPVSGVFGTCVVGKALPMAAAATQIFKERTNASRFWLGRLKGVLPYSQKPDLIALPLIEAYSASL